MIMHLKSQDVSFLSICQYYNNMYLITYYISVFWKIYISYVSEGDRGYFSDYLHLYFITWTTTRVLSLISMFTYDLKRRKCPFFTMWIELFVIKCIEIEPDSIWKSRVDSNLCNFKRKDTQMTTLSNLLGTDWKKICADYDKPCWLNYFSLRSKVLLFLWYLPFPFCKFHILPSGQRHYLSVSLIAG